MEAGTTKERLPNPTFVSLPGRPAITPEFADRVIEVLNEELDNDAFGVNGQNRGVDAGCDFRRLASPQREALVQELMIVVLSDGELHTRALQMGDSHSRA